jgi:hypothetical protein
MSFSYSGIVGYGKATLPSVEAGLGSMNILRDPPKSITTRRIDKVGQTSSITDMIDDSGNRACEAISLYARGVNPFVSVNYGNSGNIFNNGSIVGNGGQAYLPYRVNRDGAFRPPIMRQEELMPLSRQNRIQTSAFSQPGFVDFSKKLMCGITEQRTVKQNVLKACIRPTATYIIETPMVEPFEVKYVIKNPIKTEGRSGIRTMDNTFLNVQEPSNGIDNKRIKIEGVSGVKLMNDKILENQNPSKEIDSNPLHANVYVNRGTTGVNKYDDISNMDTDRFLQDNVNYSIGANKSLSIEMTPIDECMDVNVKIKNPLNVTYLTNKIGYDKNEYIHNDKELGRRVLGANVDTNKYRDIYVRGDTEHQEREYRMNHPITQAFTNYGANIQGEDNNSRDYTITKNIDYGSYGGRGQMPVVSNNYNINENFESDRTRMNKKIMEMQTGRYAK